MNRGIVKIGEIIGEMEIPVSRQERETVAPYKAIPKVVGDPTREPINRQAALICSKAAWIYHPMPPEVPPKSNVELLMHENSELKLINKNIIEENSALKRKIEKLKNELSKKLETPNPQTMTDPCITKPSKKQMLIERLSSY